MKVLLIAKADTSLIDSDLEDNSPVKILIKSLICKMVIVLS